jgi:hypothetical protein
LLVAAFFLLVAAFFLLVTVRFFAVVRFLLAERLAALRPFGFAAVLRALERTEPLVLFLDAAAFNCFPLCWIVAPALEQDAQEPPGSASQLKILAEGLTADPTLFS